jgi:hypothetical protein
MSHCYKALGSTLMSHKAQMSLMLHSYKALSLPLSLSLTLLPEARLATNGKG